MTDRARSELPATVKVAIDWMVFLDSGNAQPCDKTAFEEWLGADPSHRQAWESLNYAFLRPSTQSLRLSVNRREAQALQPELCVLLAFHLNAADFCAMARQ